MDLSFFRKSKIRWQYWHELDSWVGSFWQLTESFAIECRNGPDRYPLYMLGQYVGRYQSEREAKRAAQTYLEGMLAGLRGDERALMEIASEIDHESGFANTAPKRFRAYDLARLGDRRFG